MTTQVCKLCIRATISLPYTLNTRPATSTAYLTITVTILYKIIHCIRGFPQVWAIRLGRGISPSSENAKIDQHSLFKKATTQTCDRGEEGGGGGSRIHNGRPNTVEILGP